MIKSQIHILNVVKLGLVHKKKTLLVGTINKNILFFLHKNNVVSSVNRVGKA